jgi:hypothetical protein
MNLGFYKILGSSQVAELPAFKQGLRYVHLEVIYKNEKCQLTKGLTV